jgi:hypothetical protein
VSDNLPTNAEMVVRGNSDLAGKDNDETRRNLACSQEPFAASK